jgi:hypothetical protein
MSPIHQYGPTPLTAVDGLRPNADFLLANLDLCFLVVHFHEVAMVVDLSIIMIFNKKNTNIE